MQTSIKSFTMKTAQVNTNQNKKTY